MTEDPSAGGTTGATLATKGELGAALLIAIGAFVLIGGVLVLVGATGEDIPSTPATETPVGGSGSPTAEIFPIVPQNPDEEAIHELARLSIVLLPEGRWQELYDDFVTGFPQRCSREQFIQAGVDAANELGESLDLLGFKGLRELEVAGDTARVVIVGELRGQSEYEVEAYFRLENGVWKFDPAPGTTGCSAFNRLTA